MTDKQFVLAFILCYFFSLEALALNRLAGRVALYGSVIGITAIAWTQPKRKVK